MALLSGARGAGKRANQCNQKLSNSPEEKIKVGDHVLIIKSYDVKVSEHVDWNYLIDKTIGLIGMVKYRNSFFPDYWFVVNEHFQFWYHPCSLLVLDDNTKDSEITNAVAEMICSKIE